MVLIYEYLQNKSLDTFVFGAGLIYHSSLCLFIFNKHCLFLIKYWIMCRSRSKDNSEVAYTLRHYHGSRKGAALSPP